MLKPYTITVFDMINQSYYDTKKYLSVIPENKFACLTQDIMANQGQGIKGGKYTSHNRTDKIQC